MTYSANNLHICVCVCMHLWFSHSSCNVVLKKTNQFSDKPHINKSNDYAECKSRCVSRRVAVLHTAVTVINPQQVIKVYYKNGLFMELLR